MPPHSGRIRGRIHAWWRPVHRVFQRNRFFCSLDEVAALLHDRLAKLGQIAAWRQLDANLVVMAFFVVVLGQLLAQLGRRDAHDGVGTGVVVHLSTKDRDAQSPLFGWPIVSTVQRLLNDELEEDTEPLAQSKKWMGEKSLQLDIDGPAVFLA